MQVAAWSRILPDLLWDTLKEVSANDRLISWLRLDNATCVLNDRIEHTWTVLVDKACTSRTYLVGVLRTEILAHLVLARCILVWWGVFKVRWVLEWTLGHITLQERVSFLNWAETRIDWPLDDVLRLLGVCIVVLWPWIVYCIQVSVWLPAIRSRIKDWFCLWASLDFSKDFNDLPFF